MQVSNSAFWPEFMLQTVLQFIGTDHHLFCAVNREWRAEYLKQNRVNGARTALSNAMNLAMTHFAAAIHPDPVCIFNHLVRIDAPEIELFTYCTGLQVNQREMLFRIIDHLQNDRIISLVLSAAVEKFGYYNLLTRYEIKKRHVRYLLQESWRHKFSVSQLFACALEERCARVYKLLFQRFQAEIVLEYSLAYWMRALLRNGQLKEAKWLRKFFYKGQISPCALIWSVHSGEIKVVNWILHSAPHIPKRVKARAVKVATKKGYYSIARQIRAFIRS